jgi:hypothetical protein
MLDEAVCPWNERAATSETAPAKATAPAIIQRLMRVMRASPASRDLVSIAAISAADDRPDGEETYKRAVRNR